MANRPKGVRAKKETPSVLFVRLTGEEAAAIATAQKYCGFRSRSEWIRQVVKKEIERLAIR